MSFSYAFMPRHECRSTRMCEAGARESVAAHVSVAPTLRKRRSCSGRRVNLLSPLNYTPLTTKSGPRFTLLEEERHADRVLTLRRVAPRRPGADMATDISERPQGSSDEELT
jgi:hypothetical protein